MISVYLLNFFLGLGASFLGTIPFGPINLTIVNITIKKSFAKAAVVAYGAALTEVLQAFLALHFGLLITESIEQYPVVEVVIFTLFIVVGLVFFLKKPDMLQTVRKRKYKLSNFSKGLLVGLLNPQAIPFWVFMFALYASLGWIMDYAFWHIVAFLLGVSLGKLLCLLLYGKLSLLIARKVKSLSLFVNKIIGTIFVLIGLVQTIRYFI